MPKYEKLAKILDLPMDEASRLARAAEMGFEVDAYHGTPFDISEMRPSKGGEFGQGIYFTDNAKEANLYTRRSESGAANILPVKLKLKNPYIVDKDENLYTKLGVKTDEELVSKLKELGHDGIAADKKLSDVYQRYLPTTGVEPWTDSKHFVVFDPSQVRSKFAKFDPANADSSDLSAFAPTDLSKQNPLELLDKIAGRPVRSAAAAALRGENPLDAAVSGKDTTGGEVAREVLKKLESTGVTLRAPGQEEYPLEGPMGIAADMTLDATNAIPFGQLSKIKKLLGR